MSKYWHKTENELPEDGDVVYCIPQHTLLTWNEYYYCWDEYYYCWDDEEGDDQLCEKEAVSAWCKIPEYDLNDE